jgi:hypothetical protein
MQAFFAYLAKITEITKMNIGLVVKQLRKQKKFTQSEVADAQKVRLAVFNTPSQACSRIIEAA